jgi:hypothetical protein
MRSHIIPHFILKEILNDFLENVRDKKVGFVLKKILELHT